VTAAATTAVFAIGEGPGVTAAATTTVFCHRRAYDTIPTRAALANLIAGKKMKPEKAAEQWVKANPGRVNAWLN
jgi:hypothetical protein